MSVHGDTTFWMLVCANWEYTERQNLAAIANNAMDSDSFSKGYQHLDAQYAPDHDDWEYPSPPVWDGETPYYRDDDEAML